MAYITQIGTSTLSNQNLSSALLVHTFTNTTRKRKVWISVDLDSIAGNGDYKAYIQIQRAGAGNWFESMRATNTVASGVTSTTFGSIPLIVGATDVVRVYVIGLAGDTTNPDITTYVDEEWENIDASGNAGLSAAGVDAVWDETLADHLTAGTAGQKLDELNNGEITYSGPVASSGAIEITKGDDYNSGDSRSLDWTTSSASTWPDLTGATINFKMVHIHKPEKTLSLTGTVVTPSGAAKSVRVQPTAAQTAGLEPGKRIYHFQVEAILQTTSRVVTLVDDYATVLEDYA